VRLPAIDGLRAIAVLLVVLGHAKLLPASLGMRGVDLFFVISGLCLSLPFLTSDRSIGYKRFLENRAWRILPAYWVALLLCALVTGAGFATSKIAPQPGELLWDASLLPMMGSAYNGTFWTLALEARWYFAFPLLLALYRFNRVAFFLLGIALYAVSLSIPMSLPDVGTLPCFMLGIVAADLYVKGKVPSGRVLVRTAAIILPAVLAFDLASSGHNDPFWHLAAFLGILLALGPAAKRLSWRPLVFIGATSYSIYLVHLPVVLLLAKVFGEAYYIELVIAALSVVAGIVFWKFVEAPFITLASKRRKSSRHDAGSVASLAPAT